MAMGDNSISTYLFTQGVLGVACIVMGGVIYYQQKKLDKRDDRIQALQDARVDDNKQHSNDYREMAKDNAEVLSGNSQNMRVLSEKIEVAKQAGR